MTLVFLIKYTRGVVSEKKERFMKYWSKSALSVFRYLETMSKSIDKIVLDLGKSSNNHEIINYQTTYSQTSKILKLMDRKRKLINLKVIVENGLANISKDSRRILTLFYIDGITANFISQLLGISIRTFFRQKIKALVELCNELEYSGYGKEFFDEEYASERWFATIYNNMLAKNSEDEDFIDAFAIKSMLGEIGKIQMYKNTYI